VIGRQITGCKFGLLAVQMLLAVIGRHFIMAGHDDQRTLRHVWGIILKHSSTGRFVEPSATTSLGIGVRFMFFEPVL
jgi:hypothetical protein